MRFSFDQSLLEHQRKPAELLMVDDGIKDGDNGSASKAFKGMMVGDVNPLRSAFLSLDSFPLTQPSSFEPRDIESILHLLPLAAEKALVKGEKKGEITQITAAPSTSSKTSPFNLIRRLTQSKYFTKSKRVWSLRKNTSFHISNDLQGMDNVIICHPKSDHSDYFSDISAKITNREESCSFSLPLFEELVQGVDEAATLDAQYSLKAAAPADVIASDAILHTGASAFLNCTIRVRLSDGY